VKITIREFRSIISEELKALREIDRREVRSAGPQGPVSNMASVQLAGGAEANYVETSAFNASMSFPKSVDKWIESARRIYQSNGRAGDIMTASDREIRNRTTFWSVGKSAGDARPSSRQEGTKGTLRAAITDLGRQEYEWDPVRGDWFLSGKK